MSCEDQMVQTLKESGHRPTPQRLMILSAVRHSSGHVAAADILDQVKASYPYIDMSTVYRTLDMLKQMRLISETHMGGDQHSYEWIEHDRHHHLVCLECDGVIQLDDRFVGALGSEILESYGFEADIDHLALFGMCRECRPKADDRPDMTRC